MRPPALAALLARVLAPLGWWTARATARRMARAGWRAPVPVISVDSLVGDVALPGALALIGRLQGRGVAPVVLMGGAVADPVQVDGRNNTDPNVSGSALLVSAFAPTWVAGDLVAGAQAICVNTHTYADRTKCLLLIGAAYDPSITKDLSVLIVDAMQGFGNGLCRPAGPLKEPLTQALARVDMALVIGSPALQAQFFATWGPILVKPYIQGRMSALRTGMDWQGLRAMAFAGQAEAAHLFATLRDIGAEVVRAVTLPPDAPFSAALVARLRREAAMHGAQLVTTEADAVLLPDNLRREVLVLPLRLRVADWGVLDAALDRLGLT